MTRGMGTCVSLGMGSVNGPAGGFQAQPVSNGVIFPACRGSCCQTI